MRILAANHYDLPNLASVSRLTHGVNNTTGLIASESTSYVMRIYETHRDETKVRAEHETLIALTRLPMPFHTPRPITASDGRSYIRTPDGKIAALFAYIEGTHPAFEQPDQLRDFGHKVAALSTALSQIDPAQPSEYRPYYEIEHTHPLCPPEKVRQFCMIPPDSFAIYQDALSHVDAALQKMQQHRAALEQLPHQLIHGDLNASNVLAESEHGPITAILDFEFVTRDLRVMELAVCLSDLVVPEVDEGHTWDSIAAFVQGYGSMLRLTEGEIAAVPALLALRRLDVFIHFLGRYWDGVDSAEQLARFIAGIDKRLAWIETHQARLRSLLAAACG
jgi:homoserine kinase type II